ncbi:hypothetical protein BWK57_13575 [Flavobacterium columnare]|uniref:ParA family protein n=1 Tax=Flavobacterium columnare TaxID=996 RepID=UPI000D49E8EC|nr:ParA family protein [Flavobacterium columnare]POR19420.1 hypothetical protein BWK57_13575 [Flavobacterium columnare]
MKVISIITEKGGVGKTTTSIHLGAALAEEGKKVLLIDFDSQRNLSMGYKIPIDYPYTIKNFLDGELEKFEIKDQDRNLFILSGDRNLEEKKYNSNILSKRLELLEGIKFDFIIIDCPPRPISKEVGLGEIALMASDYIISPIEPEEYSIEGINTLYPSILKIGERNAKLKFLGFFFNKVNENTRNYKKFRKIALNEAKDVFLKSYIRQDVTVEKAKTEGKTVYQISPSSRVSEDFKQLKKEILKKIKNGNI